MGKLPLLLFAAAIAAPAATQPPISGLGGGGSGREEGLRRQWLGSGDALHADRDPQRGARLLGQLQQVDRQVDRERDRGLISRADARRIRREAAQIGILYARYSDNGLSDDEADELQTRIDVLRSTPPPPRQPAPRPAH